MSEDLDSRLSSLTNSVCVLDKVKLSETQFLIPDMDWIVLSGWLLWGRWLQLGPVVDAMDPGGSSHPSDAGGSSHPSTMWILHLRNVCLASGT